MRLAVPHEPCNSETTAASQGHRGARGTRLAVVFSYTLFFNPTFTVILITVFNYDVIMSVCEQTLTKPNLTAVLQISS